jgi:hypothetical protein
MGTLINVLKENMTFGERALRLEGLNKHKVVALGKVACLKLNRKDF